MTPDAKTVMHRWFDEVWNQRREASIEELFAKDAVCYGLGEGQAELRGRSEFKVFWRNLLDAFPDLKISIQDTVAGGDKAVVRVILRGTHLGKSGFGVDPTASGVVVAGIVIGRVVEGQIVEGWNYWDQLGLLQQIGAIPAPEDRFLPTDLTREEIR